MPSKVDENQSTENGLDSGELLTMSWKEYKHFNQQKQIQKKQQGDQRNEIGIKKIEKQRQKEEQNGKNVLLREGLKKRKLDDLPQASKALTPLRGTDTPSHPHPQQQKVGNANAFANQPAESIRTPGQQDHEETSIIRSDVNQSDRYRLRKTRPPFTSGTPGPRKPHPLVGVKPFYNEPRISSPRYTHGNIQHPILKINPRKEGKYQHITPRLYDYVASERYQEKLKETFERHASQTIPTTVPPINRNKTHPLKKQMNGEGNVGTHRDEDLCSTTSFGSSSKSIQNTTLNRAPTKRGNDQVTQVRNVQKSSFKFREQIPPVNNQYYEVERMSFEGRQQQRKRTKQNTPRMPCQAHTVKQHQDDELSRKTSITSSHTIPVVVKVKTQKQGSMSRVTQSQSGYLPQVIQTKTPMRTDSTQFKSPNLSKYHLPTIEPSDSLVGRSPVKSRYDREFRRTRSKNGNSDVPSNSGSIDTDSVSTTPLDGNTQLPVRTSQSKIPHTSQGSLPSLKSSTPRHHHVLKRNTVRHVGDVFKDDLIESKPRRNKVLRSDTDHKNWPMYKFLKKDSVLACLVRASPTNLGDVKAGLQLLDSVPGEVATDLPPLLHAELGTEETVIFSPMMLLWNHPNKHFNTPLTEPFYLYVPAITGVVYNDVLQQMTFLYTADRLPWRHADCRLVHISVDGQELDLLEVPINEPFTEMVFDIRVGYIEDTHHVGKESIDFSATMEPDVRMTIAKNSFDAPTIVKLRVEPLDMTETDLRDIIPSQNAVRTVAVSPILKVTTSEPSKRPLVMYVPKPGHTVFGSIKLGLKCKLSDIRGAKVTLYLKNKKSSKYQPDSCLKREFVNEYEFTIQTLKAWTSCYCFLVLEGQEPPLQADSLSTGALLRRSALPDVEGGFLTNDLLKRLSLGTDMDELTVRSLAVLLTDIHTTDEILKTSDRLDLATFRVLKRWRHLNAQKWEGSLVRHLAACLKEIGSSRESLFLQDAYNTYVREREAVQMIAVFDELKQCPSVLVNWQAFALLLDLSEEDIYVIHRQKRDARQRCGVVLKRAFEKMRIKIDFHRDILLTYINGLKSVGCGRIAASIEKRHLSRFHVNIA